MTVSAVKHLGVSIRSRQDPMVFVILLLFGLLQENNIIESFATQAITPAFRTYYPNSTCNPDFIVKCTHRLLAGVDI